MSTWRTKKDSAAAGEASKKATGSNKLAKEQRKVPVKSTADKETVKSGAKIPPKTPTSNARTRERKPQVAMTAATIDKVLEQVAQFSLVRVCAQPGMPNRTAFLDRVATDEDLQRRYAAAMAARVDKYAEETIEIADDGSNDTYVDAEGMVKVDTDVVARSKLRIAARQWYASKIAPKKYGDKVDLNHGGQVDNPLAVLLSQVNGTALTVVKGGADE